MSDSNEIATSWHAVKQKVHTLVDSHLKGEKNLNQIRASVGRWWRATRPYDRATVANNLQRVVEESFAALAVIQSEINELYRSSAPRPFQPPDFISKRPESHP